MITIVFSTTRELILLKIRDFFKSVLLHFTALFAIFTINFSLHKDHEIEIPIEMITISSAQSQMFRSDSFKNNDKYEDILSKQLQNLSPMSEEKNDIFNPAQETETNFANQIPEEKTSFISKIEKQNLTKRITNRKTEKIGKFQLKKQSNRSHSSIQKIEYIRNNQDLSIDQKYEQILALWFDYNKQKIAHDIDFDEDYAVLRLRINKEGEIIMSKIEQPHGLNSNFTKSNYIKSFLENLIELSNPVPKVPGDYSQDPELEFLVPISL